MKKTKLLTPILTVATLASVAPIITLASCNKNTPTEEGGIELDESVTKKDQTTTANSTMTTYVFNVKSNKVSNDEEETDEIEAELEDVETEDDVTVEISALLYDPETGKCYVTITTSKEDGTLNNEETVSFSINFHCHGKVSKKEKWVKKIEKFVIKHSFDVLHDDDAHLDDTDTQKKTYQTEKKTDKTTLSFVPSESWESAPTEEGVYDIDKLKCYVLRDRDHHWINSIKLPEYSEAIQPTISSLGTINVEIPYTIGETAHYGEKARFSLVFTYPEGEHENAVFQTIGGFSIQYVEEEPEEGHVWLTKSREQHYYLENNTETETTVEKSKNFVSFLLNPDITYTADEITVTASDERIELGNIYIYPYTIGTSNVQLLAVNYNIKQDKTPHHGGDGNVYNVSFTIKSTHEGTEWEEKINGLSFFTIGKDWRVDTLIKVDQSTLSKVNWTAAGKTDLNDVFRTCYPYNTSDFVSIYSYATIDEGEVGEVDADEFKIDQLGWEWQGFEEKSYYSRATLNTTTAITEAGKHDVKFYVYVVTLNAAYYYTLKVSQADFKAE